MNISNIGPALIERLHSYRRVLQVARKPDLDEYKAIVRICAIGMGLVGAVGFVTFMLSKLFIG